MKREEKYLVAKWDDLQASLSGEQIIQLKHILEDVNIYRSRKGRPEKKFVVVSDQEEFYEDVWKLIEKKVKTDIEKAERKGLLQFVILISQEMGRQGIQTVKELSDNIGIDMTNIMNLEEPDILVSKMSQIAFRLGVRIGLSTKDKKEEPDYVSTGDIIDDDVIEDDVIDDEVVEKHIKKKSVKKPKAKAKTKKKKKTKK